MEEIKTFEQVYGDMNTAYNHYLETGESDRLWELCHQVLSNALYLLNTEDEEDTFTYEFPKKYFDNRNGVICRLLNTGVGLITKVSTIPCEGVVWFTSGAGIEYDDDDQRLAIWEIFNVATALYKMTEPLAYYLYN